MIEIEKKCLATPQFIEFLKSSAKKLGERTFEDVCLDFEDLRLIKNDIWLRRRNGKYELKVAMSLDDQKSDVYEETDDEKQILAKLNLKDFDVLTELSVLVTHRQKFQIDDFHIDLDEVTSPGTDFLYNMMEIELMVKLVEQCEQAQQKILSFMKEHSLEDKIVNGKFIEYVRNCRPEIYESLQKNPHYASRTAE